MTWHPCSFSTKNFPKLDFNKSYIFGILRVHRTPLCIWFPRTQPVPTLVLVKTRSEHGLHFFKPFKPNMLFYFEEKIPCSSQDLLTIRCTGKHFSFEVARRQIREPRQNFPLSRGECLHSSPPETGSCSAVLFTP